MDTPVQACGEHGRHANTAHAPAIRRNDLLPTSLICAPLACCCWANAQNNGFTPKLYLVVQENQVLVQEEMTRDMLKPGRHLGHNPFHFVQPGAIVTVVVSVARRQTITVV